MITCRFNLSRPIRCGSKLVSIPFQGQLCPSPAPALQLASDPTPFKLYLDPLSVARLFCAVHEQSQQDKYSRVQCERRAYAGALFSVVGAVRSQSLPAIRREHLSGVQVSLRGEMHRWTGPPHSDRRQARACSLAGTSTRGRVRQLREETMYVRALGYVVCQ